MESTYAQIKAVCQTTQEGLKNVLYKYLRAHYKVVRQTSDYIYAKGKIPIALVAHMDTVFKEPPHKIFVDQKEKVMWAPAGLGADDRAGVFAILTLLNKGLRPHVIFTADEEIGGLGAIALVTDIPDPPENLKYIIQLDRRGKNDSVYYDCANTEFTAYINKFGFKTAVGTFSDISTICPEWEVAGVNLSVGYTNEHQAIEHLYVSSLLSTIAKVEKMLRDAPNAKKFKFIPDPRFLNYYADYPLEELYDYVECGFCHKRIPYEKAIPVTVPPPDYFHYCCSDCLVSSPKIDWCSLCGEPYSPPNQYHTCDQCGGFSA